MPAVQDAVAASVRRRAHAARLPFFAAAALLAGLLTAPGEAAAHVTVDPAESAPGVTQLYTIAVPTEKQSETVKVEVQFPRALLVLKVQAPAGWRVTPEKDGAGHILGAIWEGGSAPADQFATFSVLAQNPNEAADLSWSAIQSYADGTEVQWIGPERSQFPAVVTRVRPPAFMPSFADVVAALALAVSLVALGLAIWRRQRPRDRTTLAVATSAVDGQPVLVQTGTDPEMARPSASAGH